MPNTDMRDGSTYLVASYEIGMAGVDIAGFHCHKVSD